MHTRIKSIVLQTYIWTPAHTHLTQANLHTACTPVTHSKVHLLVNLLASYGVFVEDFALLMLCHCMLFEFDTQYQYKTENLPESNHISCSVLRCKNWTLVLLLCLCMKWEVEENLNCVIVFKYFFLITKTDTRSYALSLTPKRCCLLLSTVLGTVLVCGLLHSTHNSFAPMHSVVLISFGKGSLLSVFSPIVLFWCCCFCMCNTLPQWGAKPVVTGFAVTANCM